MDRNLQYAENGVKSKRLTEKPKKADYLDLTLIENLPK